MTEQIVHKSPSKEFNKSESSPDFEICTNECRQQSQEFIDATHPMDESPPLIREATVCYLPGTADYCVGILLETVINLSRLHDELTKLQEMLVKGGER
jgi:hypothetical protein